MGYIRIPRGLPKITGTGMFSRSWRSNWNMTWKLGVYRGCRGKGFFFGRPYNKDYNMWGSVWRSPRV